MDQSQPDHAVFDGDDRQAPERGKTLTPTSRVRSHSSPQIFPMGVTEPADHTTSQRRFSESDASRHSKYLREIRAWRPNERYEYRALPKGANIRILKLWRGDRRDPIHCTMTESPLQEARRRYDAVSYMWRPGKTLECDRTIYVDGRALGILDNLYEFLAASRSADSDLDLWVDAICIDQSNTQEKNHQVQLMAMIYKHANRTRIWLGRGDPCIDACVRWWRWTEGSFHDEESRFRLRKMFCKSPVVLMNRAMKSIGANPYWTRLWIVQEVLLSNHMQVQIQGYSLPWLDLINFMGDTMSSSTNMWKTYVRRHSDSTSGTDNPFQRSSIRPNLPSLSWPDTQKIHSLHGRRAFKGKDDIATLIKKYSWYSCSDDKDRVFAFLGLVDSDLLEADYSLSNIELFQRVVHCSLPKFLDEFAGPLAFALRIPDEVLVAHPEDVDGLSVPIRIRSVDCVGLRMGGYLTYASEPNRPFLVHSFEAEDVREGDILYEMLDADFWGYSRSSFLFVLRPSYCGLNADLVDPDVPFIVVGTACVLRRKHAEFTDIFSNELSDLGRDAQAWALKRLPVTEEDRNDELPSFHDLVLELPVKDFAKMRSADWPWGCFQKAPWRAV